VFRTLYRHVREQAKAAGDVVGIRLYVERDNAAAQATYRRLGMELIHFDLMQELLRPLR
jgi:ribosomal protein S18 acetylase RimI-like enzyme